MRGLPWCGKSYSAKELAGDVGKIFSTDEYFYKMVKPDQPDVYNFNPNFLSYAHKWNFMRATFEINLGYPLIIIDNTNTQAKEFCCTYLKYAHYQDYEVEIKEPTTDRWKEISELLKHKRENKKELKKWAEKLAIGSLETHKVPQFAIERMMWRWENDLNIDEVLQNCINNCPPNVASEVLQRP